MLGRLNENSLKFQLIVVIGMTALMSALIFSAVSSQLSRQQIERDQSSLLQHVAMRMNTQLAQDMHTRAQELLFLSRLDQIRLPRYDLKTKQDILLRMKAAYPFYAWIGLTDPQGTIVASSVPAITGADVSQREWFLQGRTTLHFGDAHDAILLARLLPKPKLDDMPMRLVDISVPVLDDQGRLLGVLAAHLSLDWAFDTRERMLDELRRDQLDLVVLNHEGKVLLGTPELPSLQVDLSRLKAVQLARTSEPAAQVETWPDGERYLTTAQSDDGFRNYPGFGWTVVVRKPEALAFAAANRVQQMIAWSGVFSALLFSSLMWWLVGRQLRPLVRLSEAARRLHPDSTPSPLPLAEPSGNSEVAHFTRSLIRLVNALRESQERFRSLFKQAPVPMVQIGADGRLLAQNFRFEAVFGYSRDEIRTADEWWIAAFPDPVRRQQAQAQWSARVEEAGTNAGLIASSEFCVVCKNGSERMVEMSGHVMPDQGVITAFHDITELRQAESRVRMWAESFEQAQLGLLIVDARTNTVTAVNPAFARERGYEREEMVGMATSHLVPQDREQDVAQIIHVLEQQSHGLFEIEHLKRDGQRFPVLLDVTVLHDEAGVPTSRVIYALDLTEHKRTQQALAEAQAAALKQQQQAQQNTLQQMQAVQQARNAAEAAELEVRRLNTELEQRVAQRTAALTAANRELDSFAFTVSHDLRAPLRTMKGFADILLHEYNDRLDEETRACIQRIAHAGERMGELIEGILSLSGIVRGELRCDTVDLSALARRRLAELTQAEPDRQVHVDVQPGLHTFGDPRLLDVLMTNLVDNAWKYTGKTGDAQIRVVAGEVNGVPGFCVKDNGAGFDMAHARRLFEPFQRMHRQDEFPGTGVGLATVQRIVQRHGGELCVQAAPGQGACFCFTLPRAPQAASEAAAVPLLPAPIPPQ